MPLRPRRSLPLAPAVPAVRRAAGNRSGRPRRAPAAALLATALALIVAACGGQATTGAGPGQPSPTGGTGGGGGGGGGGRQSEELVGTFDGDADLEGGCTWLDVGGTRYEVLWPEGYRTSFDPEPTLAGPDGQVVATAGDQVRVTGSRAEDMASLCQVGILFQSTAVSAG